MAYYYLKGTWSDEYQEVTEETYRAMRRNLAIYNANQMDFKTTSIQGIVRQERIRPQDGLEMIDFDKPTYNVVGSSKKLRDYLERTPNKSARGYWHVTALRMASILEALCQNERYGLEADGIPIIMVQDEQAFGERK